jgi:hypothetical protein
MVAVIPAGTAFSTAASGDKIGMSDTAAVAARNSRRSSGSIWYADDHPLAGAWTIALRLRRRHFSFHTNTPSSPVMIRTLRPAYSERPGTLANGYHRIILIYGWQCKKKVEAFTKNLGRGETEPPMGGTGTDGSAALTTGKKQTKRIIPYAFIREIHG